MAAHLLISIAGCQLRKGQPRQAEQAMRQLLAGAPYTEDRVGQIAIATAQSRLADALRAQGRYREALPLARLSVAGFEHSEGPDGQGSISALSSLGYLYALSGDDAKALATQREVYQRALRRWGADNQYTLVELLNLGSGEYDAGDLQAAIPHLEQAAAGLARVSGKSAPVTQAARVALANAYSDAGRDRPALDLIQQVDPVAYQATTSDPGRALVLRAAQARIELRLHHQGAAGRLRAAVAAMQSAGLDRDEIATFRQALAAAPDGRRSRKPGQE